MSEPIYPLNYPTPRSPRPPRKPWQPFATTMWLVEVALIWSVLLLFVVPHFKMAFPEYSGALPRPTQVILRLAAPPWKVPVVTFFWEMAVGLPIILACLCPYRSAQRWVTFLCIVFLLFTVVLFGTALGLPLTQLYSAPLEP